MATKFSTRVELSSRKDYVREIISITGSVVSGTYPEPPSSLSNIKRPGSEMFQSVYDYPHLSQSANQLFDITWGVRPGGTFASNVVSGTTTDTQAKFNIYNQMAALILGHDATGSVRTFDVSGNFNSVNAASVMDAPVFIDLSRLVTKDELSKGSFSLQISTSSWANPQAFTSLRTITDANSSDLENGLRILKETTNNTNVGILDRYRGIAVIQLSSSVVSTLISEAGVGNYFVSGGSGVSTRSWEFGESIHSGTIDELATGLRHRLYNLQVANITQLNTAQYTVMIGPNDFNYSSNPSYIDSSGQIRVKQTEQGQLQSSLPAYTYITGMGLYSPSGELLAIAKPSLPIKKVDGEPKTLLVKLTY